MCDVTWLQYSGKGFGDPLEKILLAAESEWGNWDCILEDFEKLLVCRADVRVMVFDDSKGVTANKTVKNLKRHAREYKDIEVGDYFVFAYYEREKDRFSVEEWRFGE